MYINSMYSRFPFHSAHLLSRQDLQQPVLDGEGCWIDLVLRDYASAQL